MAKGDNIYTVLEGQSIYDVVIQEFGTMDKMGDFLKDNSLDYNSKLSGGMKLIVNKEGEGDERVKKDLIKEGAKLSTSIDRRQELMYFSGQATYIEFIDTPQVYDDKEISFKIIIFSENFGAAKLAVSIRHAASPQDFLTIYFTGTNCIIKSSDIAVTGILAKLIPLAGLSNKVLDFKIIKTTTGAPNFYGEVTSVTINGVNYTGLSGGGHNGQFGDKYLGKSGNDYMEMVLWDFEIKTTTGIVKSQHKYEGKGITDREWRDKSGTKDGIVNGSPQIYLL